MILLCVMLGGATEYMKSIKNGIVSHPGIIIAVFAILTVICGVLALGVRINTDNSTYLPPGSNARQAMEKLAGEFDMKGSAYILLKGKDTNNVMKTIDRIETVNGVKSVIWLDDYVDVNMPVEFIDHTSADRFYKDGNALLTVLFEKGNDDEVTYEAVDELDGIIGDIGYIGGPAAISRNMVQRTDREIPIYMAVAVALILLILFSTKAFYKCCRNRF